MLCTIALRRMGDRDEAPCYALRITGKTALGPSGTGGRETREELGAVTVLEVLRQLELKEAVLRDARVLLAQMEPAKSFLALAEDVQIPFEVLERAEVYLFD